MEAMTKRKEADTEAPIIPPTEPTSAAISLNRSEEGVLTIEFVVYVDAVSLAKSVSLPSVDSPDG